ncbi:CidA/LrgA family protein [Opitutus sp. ER46]|uniref:CidA/LrgA family protein n=1 Tax=Opitutus sp. ER46 TaxID=2161864 RepID=UPI001E61F826|nr:CidA/LrgA family protein [Opitutus sp. ER46]
MNSWFHQSRRRLAHLIRGNRWVQVGALLVLSAGANALTRALGLGVPGSVVGLFILLALLFSGIVPSHWLNRGASGLLDHLMLFFVPAMLGLVDHPELVGPLGFKLLLAVLVGTPAVMIGTALVVEAGFRLRNRHAR